MDKTIHFIAQDQGSVKSLLPVYLTCTSWPGMRSQFFATKYGLDYLGLRGITCREFPGLALYPAGEDIPDLIVTGASMRDTIEKQAIACAKTKGIKTLTIVDHGSNFWGRFSATGERDRSVLPDMILAPDEQSRDGMCQAGFPPERIMVTGNPCFDAFRPAAGRRPASNKRAILCVMQPEFTAGRYRSDASWFPVLRGLAEEFGSRAILTVRPHPKEDSGVYQPFKQMGFIVDEQSDITDLIMRSDIVIGKNSTSLIEAVFRGKAVISLDRCQGQSERLPTESMGLSAVAHSETELRDWIRKSLLRAPVVRELKEIRYYSDGRNTERAAACLLSMLDGPAPGGGGAALPGRTANV